MPLYEYQCNACKHIFEKIQKFSDPLVRTCPKCGKDEVEQVLSAPAIKFKGSGWYVNDYAKKGGNSGSTSSKPESSSDIKSESKPDTKSSDSKSETKSASKKD